MKHPTIWNLISAIQLEESRVETVVVKRDYELHQRRKQNALTDLQTRLRNLCKDLIENRIWIDEFLCNVGKNIRFARH
jgi:hypothetical protein